MKVLALDVGTSAVKAAVLDVTTGDPLGPMARADYELDHPTSDAAEVPAERLWQAVSAVAREAARDHQAIEAVGLSSLTPALVLLDGADKPLGPIWTHLDRRARPVARHVWQTCGEEFLTTTGNRPLPGGITATSFRQQLHDDPHRVRRTRSYLHANGYLALRMTGERAFDPANASFTGLFNTLGDQRWSQLWCSYFEVDPAWLPPVVCGSTTIGKLRPAAAAELGVQAGLPLKLGTADTSSAMLAAEMRPGDLLHNVGTTQVLAALADRPTPSPQRLTRRFGVGPAFIHVTHNPVGGVALDWLRMLCFRDQSTQVFYKQSIPEALKRQTEVMLDPPFLGGDRLEIEAHRAAFRDLTLATDRIDLLAAVLQEMRRQHYKALLNLGLGRQFNRVFLTGGGAEIVRQLIPEYAGDAVHDLEEGALRGVAKLFTYGEGSS